MPQVKKTSVKNGILEAAYVLFADKGYRATSMPDIASRAGITPGNIYRYYKSKFELFYGVLEPWLNEQLDGLQAQIETMEDGQEKVRRVLEFMWIDLPRAENNFEMNLMEALATKKPDDPYSRKLLHQSEKRITSLLDASLPPAAKQRLPSPDLAHLMFMAHDGFVLNARLADDVEHIQDMIDGFIALLFRQD